jgi:hypothetical protein
MQMVIAVFDFPDHDAAQQHADHVPQLAVDYVSGAPSPSTQTYLSSR